MTDDNPTKPEEFAEFCKDASSDEIADRYEQELVAAREQVDGSKKLRDYYSVRAYQLLSDVPTSKLGEVFQVSKSTIGEAAREDPHTTTRSKPDVFKD